MKTIFPKLIVSTLMITLLAACGGGGASATPDTTPPSVSATTPADNATAIAPNAAITATFSEAVDPATVDDTTFTLSNGGTGSVTYDTVNHIATFTPSANLAYSGTYTATITTGVKDLAGNAIASEYSWSFMTGAAPDTTPPVVSSTTPTNNATGVTTSGSITATFNESIDSATVTAASFLVKDAGNNAVSGTVLCSGSTATFTPSTNFAYATTYTATITTVVQDLAGNALVADHTWTFTTGAAPAPSGSLDATFNGTGTVRTAVSADSDTVAAVALQQDGKIIAAGTTMNNGQGDFCLARYNADGTLDTGFNTTGIVITDIAGSDDRAHGVVVQQDGKIVVAGYSWTGANTDFALLRYNTDGSLDATFGQGGKVTTDVGASSDQANAVALQQDGKIVVAGYSWTGANTDFALVRYNTDGSLDASFDSDGKATAAMGGADDCAYAVAIQPDGKIVAAGEAYAGTYDFAVARFSADGSLDTTFNLTGTAITAVGPSFDFGRAVVLQPDGKIVVAGSAWNAAQNAKVGLVRYNADGTLDTTFNGTGTLMTAAGVSDDSVSAVAVQADGRILAAGNTYNGTKSDVLLVRYNADGSLDTSFNTTGIVTMAVGDDDYATAIATQTDGKILVAGGSLSAGTGDDYLLVRYVP